MVGDLLGQLFEAILADSVGGHGRETTQEFVMDWPPAPADFLNPLAPCADRQWAVRIPNCR
jgi:hypothetical protein